MKALEEELRLGLEFPSIAKAVVVVVVVVVDEHEDEAAPAIPLGNNGCGCGGGGGDGGGGGRANCKPLLFVAAEEASMAFTFAGRDLGMGGFRFESDCGSCICLLFCRPFALLLLLLFIFLLCFLWGASK